MEGDVEGLEDLKFQGLLLHPYKYFNKRLQEILFVLVFQVAKCAKSHKQSYLYCPLSAIFSKNQI